MNIEDIAKDIIKKLQEELDFQRHNATETLRNSFDYVINEEYIKILGSRILTGLEIEIRGAEHSDFVENSTRPHFPPIEAIEDWIAVKGLDLNAWAVAMSIAKNGTPTPGGRSIAPRRTDYVQYVADNLDYSKELELILGQQVEVAFTNWAKEFNSINI